MYRHSIQDKEQGDEAKGGKQNMKKESNAKFCQK